MSQFVSKDLTMGEVNALVKKLGGAKNAHDILADKLECSLMKARLKKISVLESLTLEQRVCRGRYDRGGCSRLSAFRITEEQHGDWEWELFSFEKRFYIRQGLNEITKAGFQPAQLGHLLAFAEEALGRDTDHQLVIAPGAVGEFSNAQIVPCVSAHKYNSVEHRDRREIDWTWRRTGFSADFSFLGVRRFEVR